MGVLVVIYHHDVRGEWGVAAHILSVSPAEVPEFSASHPGRFVLAAVVTLTHWTRTWLGLRDCLETVEKNICTIRGSNTELSIIETELL